MYFDKLGLYNYGGGGFHECTLVMKTLPCIKARFKYCDQSSSNTKLASGIAPINKFLKEGINVAIGTDGPASNNALDFFREMWLVTGLASYVKKTLAVVDAYDVLKMATVNGAEAMGLKDAKYLSVGSLADIIMLDMQQPNMQPVNNIEKILCTLVVRLMYY